LTPPVQIIATDIDTNVLATAGAGVYGLERVDKMEPERLRRFFLKGKGAQEGLVRVRPELRQLITFRQLNLLADGWDLKGPFDAIFCRNVMIYFDKDTQRKILSRFVPLMKPDALLFAGHSENFLYVSDALRLRGKTVYELEPRLTPRDPKPPMDTNSQFATNVYYDRTFDCDAAKILPGEYYYTGKDMLIVTVLGSCVSACIRDRVKGLGGMNHFMLPDGGDPATRCRPRCATGPTRWKC
jgi:hypothetical protein